MEEIEKLRKRDNLESEPRPQATSCLLPCTWFWLRVSDNIPLVVVFFVLTRTQQHRESCLLEHESENHVSYSQANNNINADRVKLLFLQNVVIRAFMVLALLMGETHSPFPWELNMVCAKQPHPLVQISMVLK